MRVLLVLRDLKEKLDRYAKMIAVGQISLRRHFSLRA